MIYRGHLIRREGENGREWAVHRSGQIVGWCATECEARQFVDMRLFKVEELRPHFHGADDIGWYRADHVDSVIRKFRSEEAHLLRLVTFLSKDAFELRKRVLAMKCKEDLPPELLPSYEEGYKLAKDGGPLDDLPAEKTTNEGVQKRLAKQLGYIDGLRERSTP